MTLNCLEVLTARIVAFIGLVSSGPRSFTIYQHSSSHAFRKAEGSLEICCTHKCVADEIQDKLSKIVTATRAAWLTHTQAFAPLSSLQQTSNSATEDDAVHEEFRWATFAAAFAKVQFNECS